MKKKKTKRRNIDIEALKVWKKTSTKGKLNWLESALRFGKLRKF